MNAKVWEKVCDDGMLVIMPNTNNNIAFVSECTNLVQWSLTWFYAKIIKKTESYNKRLALVPRGLQGDFVCFYYFIMAAPYTSKQAFLKGRENDKNESESNVKTADKLRFITSSQENTCPVRQPFRGIINIIKIQTQAIMNIYKLLLYISISVLVRVKIVYYFLLYLLRHYVKLPNGFKKPSEIKFIKTAQKRRSK